MGERFRHVAAVVLMVVFIFFLLLLLVFVGTRTTAVVGVFFFSLLFEKAFISFLLHLFLLLLMLLIGFMFAVLFHHASRGTWVTVLTKIAAVILCSLFQFKKIAYTKNLPTEGILYQDSELFVE